MKGVSIFPNQDVMYNLDRSYICSGPMHLLSFSDRCGRCFHTVSTKLLHSILWMVHNAPWHAGDGATVLFCPGTVVKPAGISPAHLRIVFLDLVHMCDDTCTIDLEV